jgi:predicted Zn-dependent protease
MLKRLLPALVLAFAVFSAAHAQTAAQDPLAIDPKHQKDIDEDIKQGDSIVKDVEKQEKVSKDEDMQKRVKSVGTVMGDLANKTHLIALWGDKRFSKYSYTFTVLQGKDVNAFSLPGGHIYVYEGLMKFVQSDDELAAVLGHEVTHAALRHVATLQREAKKGELLAIPAIIATILAGGRAGMALPAAQLINQSSLSGWSVKAENAADYGGFQLMVKSQYNPTACLTVNERLNQMEKADPVLSLDWGIFTTHPPSRERVAAILADLRTAKIPIQRSAVTTAFSVSLKKNDEGVQAWFGTKLIYTFTGDDAQKRANAAQLKLNTFFDSVPALYDVKSQGDNVVGVNTILFSVEPVDAVHEKLSAAQLATRTVSSIQGALYNLTYQVFQPGTP